MTEDQLEILALGWELRLTEEERGVPIWWGVWPEKLPDAHALAEAGWLQCRTEPDLEWRLSDQGLGSLRMSAATTALSQN
jgi:hypothetical protein